MTPKSKKKKPICELNREGRYFFGYREFSFCGVVFLLVVDASLVFDIS